MKYQTTTSSFEELSKIGSGTNSDNKIEVLNCETRQLGAEVSSAGFKKANKLKLVVPTKRSERGSRRVTEINLNGYQARALFRMLNKFYDNQLDQQTNSFSSLEEYEDEDF